MFMVWGELGLVAANAAKKIMLNTKVWSLMDVLMAFAHVHAHTIVLLCPSICRRGEKYKGRGKRLLNDMTTVGEIEGGAHILYASTVFGAVCAPPLYLRAAYVLDASDVTDSLPSQTRKMLDGLPTSTGLAYQSCPDFVNPAGRGKGWQVERLEEILAFEVPEALHPFPIAAAAW
jgi:hypothetical protein